jgi:hypothetical protein
MRARAASLALVAAAAALLAAGCGGGSEKGDGGTATTAQPLTRAVVHAHLSQIDARLKREGFKTHLSETPGPVAGSILAKRGGFQLNVAVYRDEAALGTVVRGLRDASRREPGHVAYEVQGATVYSSLGTKRIPLTRFRAAVAAAKG